MQKVKNMENTMLITYAYASLLLPTMNLYLLVFSNYVDINVLPVASYYADIINLCKKL